MVDLHVAPRPNRVNKETSLFFPSSTLPVMYKLCLLKGFSFLPNAEIPFLRIFLSLAFVCCGGSLQPQCVKAFSDGRMDGRWKVGRLGWIREHVILEMV